MKNAEFWQAAADGAADLRVVPGTTSPLRLGDVIVMSTSKAPTQLEQAAVAQLTQSYKEAAEGPDPREWSLGLYSANLCVNRIISSPLESLLMPSKLKVMPNAKDISVGLILPFDPPGFTGKETLAEAPPFDPVAAKYNKMYKVGIAAGLAILVSQALNVPQSPHSKIFDPARNFTLVQYWATIPSGGENAIVRRNIVGTTERLDALKKNFKPADATALEVAKSALKWVVDRGAYEIKK